MTHDYIACLLGNPPDFSHFAQVDPSDFVYFGQVFGFKGLNTSSAKVFGALGFFSIPEQIHRLHSFSFGIFPASHLVTSFRFVESGG